MGIHMQSWEGGRAGGVSMWRGNNKRGKKEKEKRRRATDTINTINSHPIECILWCANCIHRVTHEIFS